MTPDRILLAGLRFPGRHGVLPDERADERPFEVDLEVSVDLRRAAETDRVEDTVDYALLREAVLAVGLGPSCALLETLAERMAAALLGAFPAVTGVRLRLKKLTPPGMPDVAYAAVEIERTRE